MGWCVRTWVAIWLCWSRCWLCEIIEGLKKQERTKTADDRKWRLGGDHQNQSVPALSVFFGREDTDFGFLRADSITATLAEWQLPSADWDPRKPRRPWAFLQDSWVVLFALCTLILSQVTVASSRNSFCVMTLSPWWLIEGDMPVRSCALPFSRFPFYARLHKLRHEYSLIFL